jgi:hypothetical protein
MQKYAPMTIVHREGETEPSMREDSERGEFYYVADVDARIAEAVSRASEMEQRYDRATLRIAELEKALRFYAKGSPAWDPGTGDSEGQS